MKPRMVYGFNLIVPLVFCAKIVESLPFGEEEVRQRVHRDYDLPANQYANQQYQRPNYAQPQTVDSVNNIYQQPNNREYRQQKGYNGNNRLRDQPALPPVAERNEPSNGFDNERQINNNRNRNRRPKNQGGNFAVNDIVNQRPVLNSVEGPYRQTSQYEYPDLANENYQPELRNQFQRRPINGAQGQPRVRDADNFKSGRIEVSQPRRPDKVSRAARPRTTSNPGYINDQGLLNLQANDYLLPNKKQYTNVPPNGTMEYGDKLEGVSRKYRNNLYMNADDIIPNGSKTETIQRLRTPVEISDIDKLISAKTENFQKEFVDTKPYQYNFRAPIAKSEFVNPQYSYEYDLPKNSDTISEFRPYFKESSLYNPQSLLETPADTITHVPRFRSSTTNDFSNDVPRRPLANIPYKDIISSVNSDSYNAPTSGELLKISPIKPPTIKSTRSTVDGVYNPSISHINSGSPMDVPYKDEINAISLTEIPKNTHRSSLDNNPPILSTNTDILNIPNAGEIITTSPITNSNNEPSLMLESNIHNTPNQPTITHVSDVIYDNDGTKILAIENSNDDTISNQEKDKFHLNSLTISSMDKYISDLAMDDEDNNISPIDDESSDIERINENMSLEPFIENISAERITRFSQGEDSSVAVSAPEPIQKIFGNVLKNIIGVNEPSHIVTENDEINLEKDVHHTEATSVDTTIPNSFIEIQSYETSLPQKPNNILNPSLETDGLNKISQTEVDNTGSVYASDNSGAVTATKTSNIELANYVPVSSQENNRPDLYSFSKTSIDNYVANSANDDEVITISPIETNYEQSSGIHKLNMNMPIEPTIENISSERISRIYQEENIPIEVSALEPIPQIIGNVLEDIIEPTNLFTENDNTSIKEDASGPVDEIIIINEPIGSYTENDETAFEKDVSGPAEEIIIINEPIDINTENDKTTFEKDVTGPVEEIITINEPNNLFIQNDKFGSGTDVSGPVEEIILMNEPINSFIENDKTGFEKDLSSPVEEVIVINEPINFFNENDKTGIEKDVSNPVEEISVFNTETRSDYTPNTIINENKSYESPLDGETDDIPNPTIETESISNFNYLHETSISEYPGPVDDGQSSYVENNSILRAPLEPVNDEGMKLFIEPVSNAEGLNLHEEPLDGNDLNALVNNDMGVNTITITHVEIPPERASEDVSFSESNIVYELQNSGNSEAEIEPQKMAATNIPINTNIQITEVTDTNQPTNIELVNENAGKSEVWFKTDGDLWDKLSKGDINYDVVYLFQVHDQPVVERTTKTTVFPNGTIIQEHFETTWDFKDSKPIIIQTSKTTDCDKDADGQVVTP